MLSRKPPNFTALSSRLLLPASSLIVSEHLEGNPKRWLGYSHAAFNFRRRPHLRLHDRRFSIENCGPCKQLQPLSKSSKPKVGWFAPWTPSVCLVGSQIRCRIATYAGIDLERQRSRSNRRCGTLRKNPTCCLAKLLLANSSSSPSMSEMSPASTFAAQAPQSTRTAPAAAAQQWHSVQHRQCPASGPTIPEVTRRVKA